MEGRLALFVVCLLLCAGPDAAQRSSTSPGSGADGEIHLYLQPAPLDADLLAFSIGEVAALSDAGLEVPLDVALDDIGRAERRRQRRMASGSAPVGSYSGFLIRIRKASVRRDRRESALLVPDTPVRVDVPFVVTKGRAVVVWLDLRSQESIVGGVTFAPAFSAAIAPRPMPSLSGFVSNAGSDSLTVFDKRRRLAAAVIPTNGSPAGLALDRLTARLYVAFPGEDEIRAVDVASGEIVDQARTLPGDRPTELVLTPDGRTLVALNAGSNSVSLLDASPLARAERIAVGNGPSALAIDPGGRRVFVFNALANTISVVDVAHRAVVATLSTDAAPLRGQFDARGERLFVIHQRSPYVSVIDPSRLAVVARARTRIGIDTAKFDTRRNLLYLAGRGDPTVESYDPNTLLPLDVMTARSGIAHIAIDGDDNSLFMVSPGTNTLVVGSPADRAAVTEVDVGRTPYWVVIMGER